MSIGKSLSTETSFHRTSGPARSSLPSHITNASKELEGKRVIVLDAEGSEGPTARKADGVKSLGGSVQTVTHESALLNVVKNVFGVRAIVLLPIGTQQTTIDKLLAQRNDIPLYVAGGNTTFRGAHVLTAQETVVGKVKKLLQKK